MHDKEHRKPGEIEIADQILHDHTHDGIDRQGFLKCKRVTYFHQEPGAQLVFRYQRHLISVFIFRQTPQLALPASFSGQSSSFRVRTWMQGGLRYVVIGDAAPAIIQQLSGMLHDSR
jgi:anti-sigma factor RsiW